MGWVGAGWFDGYEYINAKEIIKEIADDIRTGSDGTVYDKPGDAVRHIEGKLTKTSVEVNKIKECIDDSELLSVYEIKRGVDSLQIPVSEPANVKISYIKGGNYLLGEGNLASAFGDNLAFSYGNYGENNVGIPFEFPEMHCFDEYDGQTIFRHTSELVSISKSGEWFVDESLKASISGTDYIAVKTDLHDFGIERISRPETDDDEATVWAEPYLYAVCGESFNNLFVKQYASVSIAVKDDWIYISLPKAQFESKTGTVRERMISILGDFGCYHMKFRLDTPTEIIDYGEKYVMFYPDKPFFANAPYIQTIRFDKNTPVVKGIRQGGNIYLPENGIVTIPSQKNFVEFKATEMHPMPVYAWNSFDDAQMISNTMLYGVSQDDVLYIRGTIILSKITAYYGWFRICQLPSSIISKISGGMINIICGERNGHKGAYKVMIDGNSGLISFEAESLHEQAENAWFTVVTSFKL